MVSATNTEKSTNRVIKMKTSDRYYNSCTHHPVNYGVLTPNSSIISVIKTPVSPNGKTIPQRSDHLYIPPPICAENDIFVICLWMIGEGRAGHGQQVGVSGYQRRLCRAQQAPAGPTQAAAPGLWGPDQCGRCGDELMLEFMLCICVTRSPLPSYSHVNCGMMGGVSSSRSSTPPAMG